jgi:hypothetical protein
MIAEGLSLVVPEAEVALGTILQNWKNLLDQSEYFNKAQHELFVSCCILMRRLDTKINIFILKS